MEWWIRIPDYVKFIVILLVFFAAYMVYTVISFQLMKKRVLEMHNSLKVGDAVRTQSGLYGTLESISQNTARLRLAENLVIVIDRFSIKEVLKGTQLQEIKPR